MILIKAKAETVCTCHVPSGLQHFHFSTFFPHHSVVKSVYFYATFTRSYAQRGPAPVNRAEGASYFVLEFVPRLVSVVLESNAGLSGVPRMAT